MQTTSTQIPFPKAGWLGSRIKPYMVRAFVRKATKTKVSAVPEALREKLTKRHRDPSEPPFD